MNEYKNIANETFHQLYFYGIKPLIVTQNDCAFIRDPFFNIKRNRVIAETLKSVIRSKLEKDTTILMQFKNQLLKTQNLDGSWNELHPDYNQPSALITSIISESLLMIYERFPDNVLEKKIRLAVNFILSQQKSNGYFIKSKMYTADHLNVDATCGAFLSLYGKFFSDTYCVEIAEHIAQHICEHQTSDGIYPYAVTQGNYQYTLQVPCIHYQGVTLYYLSKMNEVIKKNWLRDSLIQGAEWLSKTQKNDGRFDWSNSGLMFAYYLTAAYAFAFSAFIYVSQWDKKYLNNASRCIKILKENIDILCLRWEKDRWITFPSSLVTTFKTAKIGNFPTKYKLFRFGYGMYRQIARRRYSTTLNEKMYNTLKRALKIRSSTIEPIHNYSDLFITSEIIDCLSWSLLGHTGGEYFLQ